MIITAKLLARKKACESQVELFRATFGDEAEVTLENCLRAAAVGLDFDWAAYYLLSATARKRYNEAVAPARKLFDETAASARKLYDETSAVAWKLYDETSAVAWKRYKETFAPVWKRYNESCGRAFYRVVNE